MIRCRLQARIDGKWLTLKKFGWFPSVEKARKVMFKLHHDTRKHVRIMSEFGTVVDATNYELPS